MSGHKRAPRSSRWRAALSAQVKLLLHCAISASMIVARTPETRGAQVESILAHQPASIERIFTVSDYVRRPRDLDR